MRQSLLVLSLVAYSLAVRAEVSADRVMARQNWPWTSEVRVSYVLTGATGPVDVNPTFYDGEIALVWSGEGVSGDVYGVTGNHDHVFTVDLRRAFPSMPSSYRKFRVVLTPSAPSAKSAEVLYKAFRFADNTWTDITRGELLNGKYGAVETDYSRIGTGFSSTMPDVCVWTGVTNDVKWAKDYLVLRKIPAGSFTFMPLYLSNFYPNGDNRAVIDYDYWVGVFPVTQAQYEEIYVKGNPDATEWCGNDGKEHPYEYGNIYTNALAPVGSLYAGQIGGNDHYGRNNIKYTSSSCFFGRLYARCGVKLRVPTIFEHDKAVRAGSGRNDYYYDGASKFHLTGYNTYAFEDTEKTRDDYAERLGRFQKNGGTAGPSSVGSYKPNAYGLYDVIGDICEVLEDQVYTDGVEKAGALLPNACVQGYITNFVGVVNDYSKSASYGWYGSDPGVYLGNRQYLTNDSKNRQPQIGLRVAVEDGAFAD